MITPSIKYRSQQSFCPPSFSNRNHFDNSLSTLYLRGELLNSERFVTPSAGQTLTNLAVFDASSHFPHLCKIDASSSYIQIREIILLLLIFDYFTPILQHVHSDRINGGFPLLPPPHLLFFANTLISRKLDIKVFTNNKSLTNNFFSCSLFCCLNLAHFLYLFYIERVQFLRQNHIRSESISIMFYCGSHFS